ncbi:MAG TPA: MerR family transcriptional regulator [Baekduia sp.]|nr:MerR family transcriptional regulator [Baekduia sp.]
MAGVIRTNAAAQMLGVSANTLRSWERRFEFPKPRRTTGGHRQYDLAEVEALRASLEATHNISSAISMARERGVGPASSSRLSSAFARLDEGAADRVLEESVAVRSLERTIAEVLLPGVEEAATSPASAQYDFSWRFATRWMSAALRAAPPANRPDGIVIFDANAPHDVDALYAQALELVMRRCGLRTLTLGAGLEPARLRSALAAVQPRAVVLSGAGASLDALGRLVYAARRAGGDSVAILDFRGALPTAGASTVAALEPTLPEAREQLLAALERPQAQAPPRFTRVANAAGA